MFDTVKRIKSWGPLVYNTKTIPYILARYIILYLVSVLKLGVQHPTFQTIQNTSKESTFSTKQADKLLHIQGFDSAWTPHSPRSLNLSTPLFVCK